MSAASSTNVPLGSRRYQNQFDPIGCRLDDRTRADGSDTGGDPGEVIGISCTDTEALQRPVSLRDEPELAAAVASREPAIGRRAETEVGEERRRCGNVGDPERDGCQPVHPHGTPPPPPIGQAHAVDTALDKLDQMIKNSMT
jgi:hypothetical protein